MEKNITHAIILSIAVALLLSGCAQQDSGGQNAGTPGVVNQIPTNTDGGTVNQVPTNVDNPNPGPPGTGSASIAVSIEGFAFSSADLTIKAGDMVTWTNNDSAPHTVTSDAGSELGSETISSGKTYSHTFTTPGTYAYHCGLHPSMRGTVTVE